MAVLSKLGKLMQPVAKAGGRGISSLSGSKFGMGAIAAGAFGLGVLNTAAPAARDAAFDVAFGDKDADIAFTGRKLDARFLAGSAMGGYGGSALRLSSNDYWAMNPIIADSSGAAAATGAIGAGVGGFAGYGIGGVLGSLNKGMLKPALKASNSRIIRGAGSIAGLVANRPLGMLAGAVAGGVAAGLGPAASFVKKHSRFTSESPYAPGSGSMATAQALSASGDIVLGMHNSRRGY